MTANAPPDAVPRAGAREWVGLSVLALPTLLLALDLSVLHLAAPHLSAGLDTSGTQLLWILDIYGFMMAGFLVTMGTLGDRIGRRRLLLIGAATFGAASVLAAYSTSAEMLIVTRALLGVAGATLMPSTLALIRTMFRDPRQRVTAVSIWSVCFTGGTALGPVVGGVMLEHFWWGSVFLLGVPVMLLLLAVAPFLLPEHRAESAGRMDLTSVALSLATVILVIYGLKGMAEHGLATEPLLALVVGAGIGVLFVTRQRKLADPLMDLRLFANRSFAAALTIILLSVVTSGGVLLFFVQYLQMVRGHSPGAAGLWMLTVTGSMIVGSLLVPAIARRVPPGHVVAAGLGLASLAFLTLSLADHSDGGFVLAVIGASVGFFGLSPTLVLGTDLVLGSAPPERAGSASALAETAGEGGNALGIAVLGAIGAAVYRSRMEDVPLETATAENTAAAQDSLPAALTVAEDSPGPATDAFLDTARDAFTSGMNLSAVISAAIAACLAVLTLVALRRVRPIGEDTPPADGDAAGGTGGPDGGVGTEGPDGTPGAGPAADALSGAGRDGPGAGPGAGPTGPASEPVR